MSTPLPQPPESPQPPTLPQPPRTVPAGAGTPAGRRRARARFVWWMALIALAGQALAGALVAGGTIVGSMRGGLSPERALTLSGIAGILVALAAGFLASSLARRSSTPPNTCCSPCAVCRPS